MTNKLINKARDFATKAHEGQTRDNDATIPYVIHPAQTALMISMVTNDPEVIAAAWLHDTIEDTDVTYEQLEQEFSKRVADLVMEVTNEKNPDKSGYFPRLHTKEGIMIKFADRLSNISDMDGWSAKRQQAYLNKSKFWASDAKSAQPSSKGADL